MKQLILMDSEYASMGRWISVIVCRELGMTLYEGKDLVQLSEEEWLTEDYLAAFDEWLLGKNEEELKQAPEFLRVSNAVFACVEKAIAAGPCIIHERAASKVIHDGKDLLRVMLYTTDTEKREHRAALHKTDDRKTVEEFMEAEDRKRSLYRNSLLECAWGKKESYDLCLNSDLLGREKCAELIVAAASESIYSHEDGSKIIRSRFEKVI